MFIKGAGKKGASPVRQCMVGERPSSREGSVPVFVLCPRAVPSGQVPPGSASCPIALRWGPASVLLCALAAASLLSKGLRT